VSAPPWAGRGNAPSRTRKTARQTKAGASSGVRSLAKEGIVFSSSSNMLDDLNENIGSYMDRLTKLENTLVAQMKAEMDVNLFGFAVLARWRDLMIAHATKNLWQQVYDIANDVRDPIAALDLVIERASDGIIQNRVGPPEDPFHRASSTALDIGRRDFLLEAKVIRDRYRTH
jgi:hypothetical protein